MKRFARGLASTLLKLALIGAALTASLAAVFASPGALKKSLADNKVYDGIVQNALDAATKNSDTGESKAPAEKQAGLNALQAAATKAFTPEVVQSSTEQGLDGIYHWLNGEVSSPDFRIDLSQAKAQFISAAGDEAEKYVLGLPVCTKQQLREIEPDADPFSLNCRPANLTPAQIRAQATDKLTNNDNFLPNPVLTADNLPKNENGKNAFEQAEGAQRAYKTAKAMPWILIILSALLATAVFFLSETKRKGIKSLSISVLGSGLFLFLTAWLFGFFLDKAAKPEGLLGKSINGEFQASILAVVRSLNSIFNHTVLIYCIVYIALGAVGLLVLHFTKPKTAAPVTAKAKA